MAENTSWEKRFKPNKRKSLLTVLKQLSFWHKAGLILFLIVWVTITIALIQDWQGVREIAGEIGKQFNLAMVIEIIQIAVLVSIWYRVGGTEKMMFLNQKDTNSNFREVRREHKALKAENTELRERVVSLETKVELFEKLIEKDESSGSKGERE